MKTKTEKNTNGEQGETEKKTNKPRDKRERKMIY